MADPDPQATVYDFEVTRADGGRQRLGEYRGEVLLIVNVASQCGFTPQYEGLQALQDRYGERGFRVLGFPCNQFGRQEPGDADSIRVCGLRFGVSFPVFARIEVNGEGADPLFRHLKTAGPGALGTQRIKWNFTKFLVGRDGRVIRRFAPTRRPQDLASAIERALDEPAPASAA
ncbi:MULTISPECIES: glutathione peroxidase [unclassified Thioalkalivibrio]|uniref:glutathione peroxidase n=1 Tax=unclassified Thioalkalivibrio TaxID=2621013 RepID=UPI00035F0732|nr:MULTISPECIES: glutathione peroxidase [unclassified Thioalkalivibrio]